MRSAAAGLDDDVADTAVLLTSEVVTNALLHTRSGDVAVRAERTPRGLRVAVSDDDHGLPKRRLQAHGALDTTGRGVVLLDLLSADWGVDQHPGDGKTVWFEVAA